MEITVFVGCSIIANVKMSHLNTLHDLQPSSAVLDLSCSGSFVRHVILVVFVYEIILAIYRVKFHPLAKYPGPLLAQLTVLYPLYHAIVGDRHPTFWRLHKRYGSIVRCGPNQLSFNTATGLKDIYGPKANVQKSEWYTFFRPLKGAVSVWTCIDKVIHSRKR